ncbi:uncharacterized protein FA14DRAFT_161061 [Meira miltonrushii]|uniref:Brl1/Brr6 domain-containing protein n=1 Tax=Meira miltonrushii TaxID=1280837 RepID=A0A316VF67_9BASI|nr:uncharacterized protein FA14DRAFT_161061 [Meira miltonrushii]PWN36277.1 hypothetical protein FA14DRAFT_161061 [Meira miltonrushii]
MYSNKQQQQMRSRDSPMDFAYDSPSKPSGAWLNSSSTQTKDKNMEDAEELHNERKRSLEMSGTSEPFVFGNNNQHSGGAFLFQQPLSPTIEGPDVDMATELRNQGTSSSRKTHATRLDNDQEQDQSSSSRRPVSQGAVQRVNRQRAANNKKPSSLPRRRKTSLGRRGLHGGEEDEENDEDISAEWEDDEKYDTLTQQRRKGRGIERQRSLSRRVGDTLNIHYFFNGSNRDDHMTQTNATHRTQTSPPRSWLDPEWCLGMAQFGFNATLLIGVVWVLFNVVRTLQRDVSSKVREYEMEYLAEIEACSQSYHLNRCGTDGAVPALANACANWQRCSARDPANVGRARVAAETVAEIVNGFVDVVSWKSMLFTLLSLIIIVGATNSFLSFFRIRSRANKGNKNSNIQHQDDPRHAIPPPHEYGGYDMHSHDHYLRSRAWHPSSPTTPQSKRMCR